ncbi:hypothetical protein CYMTET_27174 [Cymbomonas tetramitiformis]|uniref:Uncharacterized protein n=1 Tax=Cymbomonas tetramitiformis TaxID=36881 RepID=A0AAE0KXH6_9CHLO|nr:hypothetical protein CYMTET_27174 [Cymbomonas tetramitiformis]
MEKYDEHWAGKLGDSSLAREAAEMQAAALQPSTAGNYEGHRRKFVDFCVSEQRGWLPATEETVLLYIAVQLRRGTTEAAKEQGCTETVRTWLPAATVRRVHKAAERIGPDTGREGGAPESLCVRGGGLRDLRLTADSPQHPDGCSNMLACSGMGVVMEKVCFFGGWSQLSSAELAHIDPTAVVDNDKIYYFSSSLLCGTVAQA